MMNLEMMMENDDDDGHDHEHEHVHEQEKPYEGLRMKAHDHGNKHPYFLRAKAPRLLGFPVRGEHHHQGGEFKKPSIMSSGVGAVEKERPVVVPSFHSNKIDRFDEFSEEEDLANCLVMLSSKSHVMCRDENQVREGVDKGMFQCKACKKVFNSHQALGGHRASHKKVKGCFASKIDDLNDDENINVEESSISTQEEVDTQLPASSSEPTTSRKRTKMHECSVCRRVFSSGQALGGHKRCHWLTSSADNAFIPNFHDLQYDHHQISQKPYFTKPHEHEHGHEHEHDLDLNLNLPPSTPHDDPKHNDDKDKSNNNKHDHASTRLCLQQWSNANHEPKMGENINGGEEEGCGIKRRKLSDLSDVNLDGGWLQMGIPSTSEMR